MRKLTVSLNITLDGFVAAEDEGLDWHSPYWSDEIAETTAELLSKADTILLGKNTYQAMAAYWPFQAKSMNFPRTDIAYADMMNTYQKVVISSTMNAAWWNNSLLLKGDLRQIIGNLKKQNGRDILTYGSISVVKKLAAVDLIDEYQLWVHPVILGNGRPLFNGLKSSLPLKLLSQKVFSSGVILMVYQSHD
ncbi:dihydrofolate reductase family protein [Mucilaginibacter kameinonensis]|uniref:dihydrofolate reductase family protein n=1 Tax=Mucilaginibacter kameinonensis TaxID=452286 RepID=UPI000EF76575|nr:dihydrofolate reductase family protein [Mucilaginibacter kameinonensis]